ncbi:MAG: PLD nuclease N-terminal domain-containing protein [Patescibacteria group bacterium]|nr:MAG: PLD nuclease N-terminal domain-containing protein [Patescibacteria group bacterium]
MNAMNIAVLMILALDIVAIMELVKSSKDTTHKVLWILAILLAPALGLIAYFIFGRKGGNAAPKV